MDFYELLKQQYKDYKAEYDALTASCEGCPCKTLREKVFGTYEQTDCTGDIMYLANKYKIDDFEAYSCDGCALTAVRIAKKISKKVNKI